MDRDINGKGAIQAIEGDCQRLAHRVKCPVTVQPRGQNLADSCANRSTMRLYLRSRVGHRLPERLEPRVPKALNLGAQHGCVLDVTSELEVDLHPPFPDRRIVPV